MLLCRLFRPVLTPHFPFLAPQAGPGHIFTTQAMSAGGSTGGSNFVWIKLDRDVVFAHLRIESAVFVGEVTTIACKEFPRWRLDAGQVRIHLATVSGKEPSEEEICAARATTPLAVSASVTSGAWLVAVPATPSSVSSSFVQGPLQPILLQPLPSPTNAQAKSFLTNDQAGFLCEPATLPCDASVAAAFRRLLERVGGDTRELMKEKAMYASASKGKPLPGGSSTLALWQA